MPNERFTSIWDALADSPAEAENLRIRSQLMIAITQTVEAWGESQTQSAKRLGVTQPRLNDLLKGRIEKFSLDALVNLLSGAGLAIEINVIPQQAA
jgi:predicted XRE-type DNA-binding protein